MRYPGRWVWIYGLLGALAPGRAAGQEVHGFVFYVHNEFPVAQATVRLVDAAGTVAAATSSGPDGRFHLVAPSPGEYHLHVEHLTAFDMVDGPVALESGRPAVVTFQIVPLPIAVEGIRVEVAGRSLPLARTGFYERQRFESGFFVGPEKLEKERPLRLTDLMRRAPGVRVVESHGVVGELQAYPMMSYALRSNLSRGPCFPRVFVDGVVVEQGGQTPPSDSFDRIVATADLFGMEVYRSPAETPAQYGGMTACGAILLWTKAGRGRG